MADEKDLLCTGTDGNMSKQQGSGGSGSAGENNPADQLSVSDTEAHSDLRWT